MGLANLAESIRDVGADKQRATGLARRVADDIRPDGGDSKSFIQVVDDPQPAKSLTSQALLGCLFSVKDNIDVAGTTTTCGSKLFADQPPATEDAWIVRALESAGAICLGKNNMHELALGATGMNPVFGTTKNPWDRERGVGGSSGGSALAVALRQVHIALGTDSGGSVRIPAAWCGVVGFKPTPGILLLSGVAGAAYTIDCLGFFAQQIDDVTTVWRALELPTAAGTASGSPVLAYLQDDSMGRVDPRVWERYQAAVESLKGAGFDLTGVSISGFESTPHICVSIAYPEIASTHMALMRSKSADYDPAILALLYLGELWSGRHYLDAQRARTLLRERFAQIIAPFDAILTPTLALPPPRIGEVAQVEGDPPGAELYTLMRFTVPFNVIGYPAISVPAGLDSNSLPFGLQLIGKPDADTALLETARKVERVLGIMPAPHDT